MCLISMWSVFLPAAKGHSLFIRLLVQFIQISTPTLHQQHKASLYSLPCLELAHITSARKEATEKPTQTALFTLSPVCSQIQ